VIGFRGGDSIANIPV